MDRQRHNTWHLLPLLSMALLAPAACLHAQTPGQENKDSVAQQIQTLSEAMARAQAQIEQSQRQLDEMRRQLTALQGQLAQGAPAATVPAAVTTPVTAAATAPATPEATAAAIDDLRERQAMLESQVAVHEQSKIETESKFPLKLTGLLLLNGFFNTRQVDNATSPTLIFPGAGSTAFTVRQTILGFDATGPHLFSGNSYADLRVDFAGSAPPNTTTTSFTGAYNATTSFLRLRTAHAGVQWKQTEAFFSLDRPILSPDSASSLAAVAEPAFAWSGSLWTWNPQLGLTEDFGLSKVHLLRFQAALIDIPDAPLTPRFYGSASPLPSTSEIDRRPGLEGRIAFLGSKAEDATHIGFGALLAPHKGPGGQHFQSWAATTDFRFRIPGHFELSGNVYRGAGLGGLGAGAYKDYAYVPDSDGGYYKAFDDVGGWVQMKEKFNERIEVNAAVGMDQLFGKQLRPFYSATSNWYQSLARNRTFTGNVIYSPSAYLLFSLEYRHVDSAPVVGVTASGNIVGVAAGYRF